jgi:membrane protein implicated in regulation of membrane protease activity
MLSVWWVWVVGGLALAILETVVPGYIFVGFAIGAVATGGLLWLGVLGGNLAVQMLVFALISLVVWLTLRRVLGIRKGQVKYWDRDINEN